MNARARRPRSPQSNEASTKSVFHTGDDLEAAEERVSSRSSGSSGASNALPNWARFWMKQGTNAEIIFLDETIKSGFAFYEHQLQGADGKWNEFYVCPKELHVCPICESLGESHFVFMFSILVPNAYTDKKTGEVKNAKRLLPVKYSQWKDLKKILISAEKANGGKLRGVSLYMERDSGNVQTSPSIGKPQIDDEGRMYSLISEEDLVKDFGHDAVKSKDGQITYREANDDITPYAYAEVFTEPNIDELRRKFGGAPQGSSEQVADEWSDEDEIANPF